MTEGTANPIQGLGIKETDDMTSVATPARETDSDDAAEPGARWLRHRLAAGVASGLLLWTTFPPMEWAPLAWVALAPLFWLATIKGSPLKSYLSAWAGGLVFWFLAVPWLRLIGPGAWIGWVVLATVFSLWWPLFLVLTRWARFRLGLPLIQAAPIVWVAVEYMRAYFLTGFPWYYLAHSQYRYLHVIQIADLAGSLGVSFVIAVVNAWLVELVTLPLLRRRPGGFGGFSLTSRHHVRLWSVMILVGGTLGYGYYRLSTAQFRDGPRVALLQSNHKQGIKFLRDQDEVRAEFLQLIERAMSHDPHPELIVWPETSYPFGFIMIDPAIAPDEFKRQVASIPARTPISVDTWLGKRSAVENDLHSLADAFGASMLVGTRVDDHEKAEFRTYNSAVLFRPGAPKYEFYHKMHLVPFGEFIPYVETIPLLATLTPYRDKIPHLNSGQDATILPLGPYRLAASICFEDTIPHVINEFFHGADQSHQPDLLINLSNDGWYPDSSELDMHLAIGVFRTVEHRVPLARAVNTGLSAVVDGNGEIRAVLPKSIEDVLVATVPLDDRTTYYSRWGDWLGLSSLAVTIGLIPMGLVRTLKSRQPRE
jgi:apolipoprotein N-acyltransferase